MSIFSDIFANKILAEEYKERGIYLKFTVDLGIYHGEFNELNVSAMHSDRKQMLKILEKFIESIHIITSN